MVFDVACSAPHEVISVDEFRRMVAHLEGEKWPWISDPYRLYSLVDMYAFREVVEIIGATEQVTAILCELKSQLTAERRLLLLRNLKGWFEGLGESCKSVPISRYVHVQINWLLKSIPENSIGINIDILSVRCHDLIMMITADLSDNYFLFIAKGDRDFYEQKSPIFGSAVAAGFPSASREFASAGRCFALDEHTACVFHLMRGLEVALRVLAVEVGLTPEEVALDGWKTVIDRIEKQVRAMEALPKSEEKSERVRLLSGVAQQFRYFKDAWRNHVAHARSYYDGREADSIMRSVADFMRQLADCEITERGE